MSEYTRDISISVNNIDNLIPEIDEINTEWTNQDLEISINARDSASTELSMSSGLHDEAYSFDAGNTWQSSNTFTYTVSGEYEVMVRDKAENIATRTFSIKIDRSAPSVSLSAPGDWTSGNVFISASANDGFMEEVPSVSGGDSSIDVSGGDAYIMPTDNISGLASEPYSWDGGNTWTANSSYEASENGTYSVLARDNAGNISSASITISCIDRSAPEIFVEKQFDNWPYYEESMLVTVNAADSQSGLHPEAYSFDGGNTWTSSNTITVKNSFCLPIAVRDNVGNICYQSIDIVKEAAPVVSVQPVIIPVPPTVVEPEVVPPEPVVKPKEEPPEPELEPEPELKPEPVKKIEPPKEEIEVVKTESEVEIIEDVVPTFALPQFIATAGGGATATGGMIFFIVFWVFNKCTIRDKNNCKVGKAYIRKKNGIIHINLPKKLKEKHGSCFDIYFNKKFAKSHVGKPVIIRFTGGVIYKNISEKISINI